MDTELVLTSQAAYGVDLIGPVPCRPELAGYGGPGLVAWFTDPTHFQTQTSRFVALAPAA
jgi:hypothetical protein